MIPSSRNDRCNQDSKRSKRSGFHIGFVDPLLFHPFIDLLCISSANTITDTFSVLIQAFLVARRQCSNCNVVTDQLRASSPRPRKSPSTVPFRGRATNSCRIAVASCGPRLPVGALHRHRPRAFRPPAGDRRRHGGRDRIDWAFTLDPDNVVRYISVVYFSADAGCERRLPSPRSPMSKRGRSCRTTTTGWPTASSGSGGVPQGGRARFLP
jgi:hypothetical protein